MIWLFLILGLAILLAAAYLRLGLKVWSILLLGLGASIHLYAGFSLGLLFAFWIPLIAVLSVLNVYPLRRRLISGPVLAWFRKVLPPISQTEQEAVDAGGVWWDAELFSGKPDWKKLVTTPAPKLSPEEQAFLDGPVEELCGMLDQWEIHEELEDLPAEAWQFIKDKGFFGMIIPKSYGGLEFSAQANSAVVLKLASHNQSAATTVMVPNSLGPGELLLHFGTEEQKDHYLPRLASGKDIPCFALTGPYAGSDASAMPDEGIICKGQHNGEEVLGMRVSWDKRYITLAPIATVLGLAIKVRDPDHLLGDETDLGITCCLIPTDTPGVKVGERHIPTGSVFLNGPTEGKDVFVPLDWVIGGRERVGQGWRMLMYCLSAGRAISLPALGTAGAKFAVATTGAYARIRRQFRQPIGNFEGIQEVLARMAGETYRMDAARQLTLCALDQGEKPAVLSAILKYNVTEGYRRAVIDAMDVHGGKAIIEGPSNYLAKMYQSLPVSITVEGANILTRTMIIFGQGAIRCHPHLFKEMQAASLSERSEALIRFDRAFISHIGFTISNCVRSLALGISAGWLARTPSAGRVTGYYRQLTRMSAAFAMTADITLLLLGGKFKFKERISGRFADILSHLYMASAVLKRYRDAGEPEADLPLVDWALQDSLCVIQDRMEQIFRNYPSPALGRLLKRWVMPWGRPYAPPSDSLGREVAEIVLSNGDARKRLVDGIYLAPSESDAAGCVEDAFRKALASESAQAALRNGLRTEITPVNAEALVAKGLEAGVITGEQADQIKAAQAAAARVIAVDAFSNKPEAESISEAPTRAAS